MKLLVGLGNPGIKYELTRHNAGFRVLEEIVDRHDGKWGNEAKANALVTRLNINKHEVIAALPQSYMNLSGEVVVELLRWFKLSSSDLIVVHDELDLSFGTIQVKKSGGDAGHNGIKSIIERIGQDFLRVRIGIDRPKDLAIDRYVLEKFTSHEEKEIKNIIKIAADKTELLVEHGYDTFVSKYNS